MDALTYLFIFIDMPQQQQQPLDISEELAP